jgi:hypothetical protein
MPVPKSPSPISLSDQELDAIMRAASPLEVRDRGKFLEEMAHALATRPDIGIGGLHRLIMEVQRKHWSPPIENGNYGSPKHRGSKYSS